MADYKPSADIKVKVREYTDENGKKKGVWHTIAVIMSTPHESNQFVIFESIPFAVLNKDGEKVPFDGKASIFKREDFNQSTEQEDKVYTPTDEEINLNDIGF